MSDEDLFDVDTDAFSAPVRPVSRHPVDVEDVDEEDVPATYFGSADEWVRKFLRPSYRRRVTAKGQAAGDRWAAEWWSSVEALTRIEALWRMWEEIRTSAGSLSAYWINHLDPHMRVLLSPNGPFVTSTGENRPGDMLPYAAPPAGMFPLDTQN